MKILLTGASSDIGLRVTEQLVKNLNHFTKLVLIYNSTPTYQDKDFLNNDKIEIIKQNLMYDFKDNLKKLLGETDILIHLAWMRPKNPIYSVDTNIAVIKKIFEYLNKKAKVIFLSSVAGIPNANSYYGKSKFEVSKKIYKNYETSIFLCGLIITDSQKSAFHSLKRLMQKLPLMIKFGNKVEILHTKSDIVVNAINNKIINFKKGIFKLYNDDEILLDDFVKKNFNIEKDYHINISFFVSSFLLIGKYINYIPMINKITDMFITLITNNKLKTDRFIKEEF